MGKMTKTEKKIRSLQASAKNARTALKEHRTPGGVLMSEAPATIAGAGVVGATRAAGFTDFLGAPTDIALSIAFAGAGLASGSPALLVDEHAHATATTNSLRRPTRSA